MNARDLVQGLGTGVLAIFFIISFVFWISMLVHALSNPIKDKLVWVLILIFLAPIIGPLLYYFIVKNKK